MNSNSTWNSGPEEPPRGMCIAKPYLFNAKDDIYSQLTSSLQPQRYGYFITHVALTLKARQHPLHVELC